MPSASLAPIAVSIAEAAKAMGISDRHARNLAHAGEIPTIQLGGRAVVPVRWLEAQAEKAIAAAEQQQGSVA